MRLSGSPEPSHEEPQETRRQVSEVGFGFRKDFRGYTDLETLEGSSSVSSPLCF